MAVAGCNLQKYLVLLQFCRYLKNCLLRSQNLALNMPVVRFGIFCNSELSEMLDLITEKSPSEGSRLFLCITDVCLVKIISLFFFPLHRLTGDSEPAFWC